MRILVTGGAGYVGSHACVELIGAGHEVVVVDNMSNGSPEALARVERITGVPVAVHEADVRDRDALRGIFAAERVDAVMHFAALKAVAESVEQPLRYFENNVGGTLSLAEVMCEAGVDTIVFSSSATVYGIPASVPIDEQAPLAAMNPYGRSKLMVEGVLTDLQAARPGLRVGLLRYFNPGGAHASGLIGESPRDIPNNLLPFVSQVAVGRLPRLKVFGGDYPTHDGTGVRDYIHVVDLAKGHVGALDALLDPAGDQAAGGVLTLNLGTGRGHSVFEVVRAFERASGRTIPCDVVDRRPGDIAECYADPRRAERLLGWRAERGLADICADAWRWQQANPDGYTP